MATTSFVVTFAAGTVDFVVDIVAAFAVAVGGRRFDTAAAFAVVALSSDTGWIVIVWTAVSPSDRGFGMMVADTAAAFASVAPVTFEDIFDTAGIAPHSCPADGIFAY